MRLSDKQIREIIRGMSNQELSDYIQKLEDSKSSFLYQSNPVAQVETNNAIDTATTELDRRKNMDESEAKYRADVERINQQYQAELKAARERNIEGYLKAQQGETS